MDEKMLKFIETIGINEDYVQCFENSFVKFDSNFLECIHHKTEFFHNQDVEFLFLYIPKYLFDFQVIIKIFAKFVQLDSAYTKKESSTGLGLTITKELVELHGGKISLISEVNNGSTFIVEIPLQKSLRR